MTDRYLRAGGLTPADIASQKYTHYFEEVGSDVTYSDLFHPNFYRHHRKLRPFDIIRLVHPNRDFDVFVSVRQVIAGGVTVDFFGGRPPKGVDPYKVAEEELAAAMMIQVVPIDASGKPTVFVQHLPRTKWRVIGLANTEIKRDIATKEEAEVVMFGYLADIRMRLPTNEELLAEIEVREATRAAIARAEAEKLAQKKTQAA